MELIGGKYSNYDPVEGLIVHRELTSCWKNWGDIKKEFRPYENLEKHGHGAGLYAFVLEDRDLRVVLYIGKGGGLKPKSTNRWANNLLSRALTHWKSGPFRGLADTIPSNIHLWTLDFKAELDQVGERDIERIENELLKFCRKEKGGLPAGNVSTEGGSKRHFEVGFQFVNNEPLPRIALRPGELGETRKGRKPTHDKGLAGRKN